MTLDRASTRWLRKLAESPGADAPRTGPAQVRAWYTTLHEGNTPGPEMRMVDDRTAAAGGVEVPVRVVVPNALPGAVVLFLHGGGGVAGSVEESDTIVRKLAERTGAAFISVDYRLAPEHPFPAALDDAWTALVWAAEQTRELVGRDVPLLVCGEELGGNLAAAIARRTARVGGPALARQILLTPFGALEEGESLREPEFQAPIGLDELTRVRDWYLGDAVGQRDADAAPLAVPLEPAEAAALAPATIVTAECDPLRDEGEAYVRTLAEAGVEVRHERCHGQPHLFFSVLQLPGSERGFQHVIRAVRAEIAAARRTPVG